MEIEGTDSSICSSVACLEVCVWDPVRVPGAFRAGLGGMQQRTSPGGANLRRHAARRQEALQPWIGSQRASVAVQAACVQRMYEALASANSVLEREVTSLLLATLNPQALLDAGRLTEYETALMCACVK